MTPLGGAAAQFFPGANVELASAEPGATAEATDDGLAREGFLRGVLHVTIRRSTCMASVCGRSPC